MLTKCFEGEGSCTSPLLYVTLVVLLASALATVWWLKVVYRRYETTLALPIEYGTVNVALVGAGLVLYQEYKYMETWQVTVMCVGAFVVCVGIQPLHRPALPRWLLACLVCARAVRPSAPPDGVVRPSSPPNATAGSASCRTSSVATAEATARQVC